MRAKKEPAKMDNSELIQSIIRQFFVDAANGPEENTPTVSEGEPGVLWVEGRIDIGKLARVLASQEGLIDPRELILMLEAKREQLRKLSGTPAPQVQ